MMGAGAGGMTSTPSTAKASSLAVQGASKGVPFSRVVTIADTSFANITVTFPRSSKPIKVTLAVSAGSALAQIQGLGAELYAGVISPNLPADIVLTGLPETTYVVVQVEQLAASTIGGVVFYN